MYFENQFGLKQNRFQIKYKQSMTIACYNILIRFTTYHDEARIFIIR